MKALLLALVISMLPTLASAENKISHIQCLTSGWGDVIFEGNYLIVSEEANGPMRARKINNVNAGQCEYGEEFVFPHCGGMVSQVFTEHPCK